MLGFLCFGNHKNVYHKTRIFFTTLDCLQILKPFIWKKSLSIITATEDSCFNEFNFLQVNENLECVLDLMCHKSPQIKSSSNSFFFSLSLTSLSFPLHLLLPFLLPSPYLSQATFPPKHILRIFLWVVFEAFTGGYCLLSCTIFKCIVLELVCTFLADIWNTLDFSYMIMAVAKRCHLHGRFIQYINSSLMCLMLFEMFLQSSNLYITKPLNVVKQKIFL